MKEVQKVLKDRLKSVLMEKLYCLFNADYYLHNCRFYNKCERSTGFKYRDFVDIEKPFIYRISIDVYLFNRDEIKVLVKVLKMIREK